MISKAPGTPPMVSIIIPTFNSEKTIFQCVQSILSQKIQEKEIIIVDGKSSDKTIEISKQFQDKSIKIICEKDNGIYDAMNKGIMQSKGDWLYFLGSDDILLPNVFEIIFNKSNIYTYDMIYGNVLRVPSNTVYDGRFDLQKLFTKNLCHQSIFYKKSLFSQIGLFNTQYKSRADYAFNIKVFSGNYKTHFKPITIAVFNDNGLSSNYFDWKFWEEYKTNYITPFRGVISRKLRYNKLWRYFFYLVNEKQYFLAVKIYLIISVNEWDIKNSYLGMRFLIASSIKKGEK